ncbi:hypothetical protein [Catenulispora yoronensis]|uniref:hypothetical protein n=1 Tax=Catenulispora yoronensis TaxID=450799 RepID=UPI0031E2CDD9
MCAARDEVAEGDRRERRQAEGESGPDGELVQVGRVQLAQPGLEVVGRGRD